MNGAGRRRSRRSRIASRHELEHFDFANLEELGQFLDFFDVEFAGIFEQSFEPGLVHAHLGVHDRFRDVLKDFSERPDVTIPDKEGYGRIPSVFLHPSKKS